MGKSDKTKDEGIISERGISKGAHNNETECCADGACCWNHKDTSARSEKEPGG
jgi:hypothetical protein